MKNRDELIKDIQNAFEEASNGEEKMDRKEAEIILKKLEAATYEGVCKQQEGGLELKH